jgi:hypothetical protein
MAIAYIERFKGIYNGDLVSTSTGTGTLVITGGAGISGNINSSGVLFLSNEAASTSTSTGSLVVTGGVGVSGNINTGGIFSAASIQNTPIGNSTASSGAFTTLTSNGATTFTANTASTSTATGTLVVTGGIGMSGNLNVNDGIGAHYIGRGGVSFQGGFGGTMNFFNSLGKGNIDGSEATLSFVNDSALETVSINATNGQVRFKYDTASTSTATGTLVVTGGVGVSGNLNIGGNISANNLNTGGLNTTDLVVAGNLTVNGNTTILNTEVLQVEDHQIEIGKVQTPTDTTANDGGIVLKGATDKKLTWLDATDRWTSNQGFHVDVNTASTSTTTGALLVGGGLGVGGNINAGGAVNKLNGNTPSTTTTTGTLVVTGGVGVSGNINAGGNLTVTGLTTDSIWIGGAASCEGEFTGYGGGAFLGTTASTSTATGTLVVTGGVGVGGNINVGGTVNKLTGNTASTSTATGTLVVTGGVGVSGNINAGGNASFSGTIYASSAWLDSINTDEGNITCGPIYCNSIYVANNTASTSTFTGTLVVNGGVGIGGNINVGGTVNRLTGNTASTSTSTGTLVVTGGVGVSGNIYAGGSLNVVGSIVASDLLAVPSIDSSYIFVDNGNITINGGNASTSTTTGALLVGGGAGIGGNINVGGTVNRLTGNTASTSTSTGTLVVTGGVGISGNLNVGGSFSAGNLNANDMVVAGNLTVSGNTTILNTETVRVEDHNIELGNVTTPTDTTANGGGITLKGATDKTLTWSSSTNAWTSNQDFRVTTNTASTSTSTGSLVVTGGVGIGGAIYAGSIQNTPIGNTTRNTGAFTTLTSNGATTFTANTASTSTVTGTLVVTGGVGVSGNLNVGGTSNKLEGTLTVTRGASSIWPTGNSARIEAGTEGEDPSRVTAEVVKTGFIKGPNDITTIEINNSYGGVILYDNLSIRQNLTVWLESELRGNVSIESATASTSNNSGALVVTGGVGVSGNLNVDGTVNTLTGNTASTSTATGTLVVTGGVGVSGNINAQNVKISGNTQSTSTTSGTLVVTGGVGVGGDFWIGGNVFVDNNKVFEAATIVVTSLNVFSADISGNVTIGDTLNVNKLNPGVTLAVGATPSPKVSIKVPVDFTSSVETNIFTVPVDSIFLIDSMEVLTTEITSPGVAPIVRLGNTLDNQAYYGPTQVTSNGVGARHIIENPQDGVAAGTTVTCGITEPSGAATHSGYVKVTGELIKLVEDDC